MHVNTDVKIQTSLYLCISQIIVFPKLSKGVVIPKN